MCIKDINERGNSLPGGKTSGDVYTGCAGDLRITAKKRTAEKGVVGLGAVGLYVRCFFLVRRFVTDDRGF